MTLKLICKVSYFTITVVKFSNHNQDLPIGVNPPFVMKVSKLHSLLLTFGP